MKTCITLCIVILLATINSFGQHKTYIGVEGAIASDKYEIIDPCETITNTKIITGSWGISVGQQIHKNLILESGVIWKYYDEGFEYTKEIPYLGSFSSMGTGFQTIQIPFRFIVRINLLKNKVLLTTTVGYHIGINRDYGYDFEGSSQISRGGLGYMVFGSDTVKAPTTENYVNLRKTFSLLEVGLGLEYILGNSFLIALSASYFAGLNNVYQETMSTGITNKTTTCTSNNAVGLSKGSYSNVRLSFKYVISNLWKKDKNGL